MKINLFIPTLALVGITFFACTETKTIEISEEQETAATVAPIGDSAYSLSYAGLTAVIDFKNGGRLEALSLGDKNILSGKKVNPGNWGTSLWPAPQSAWGWPPSQELDNFAYTVVQDSTEIILKSKKDPKQSFIFTKAYKINTADTTLVVTYTILNDTTIAQKVAAWEISRVAPGGLTFYPSGDEAKRGLLAPLTKDSLGATWYQHKPETVPATGPPGSTKVFADGKEGWLAQFSNGMLLVKSFEDVAAGKYAPEEGEIELYANPDHSYIEIEQQGTYVELKAHEELKYTVTYKLVKLPETSSVNISYKELLDLARSSRK
ncbi:MAG: DUF4380 domain-containing protein [Cytophaga sp.]|uniref:DUF4380 domain-containing protein n=1 Tax=Cytophaga sp. TaxID=29535 RepID=UPI003F7E41A4